MRALSTHSTGDEQAETARGALLTEAQRRQMAEDVAALRATYGPRWPRIPSGFGDRAQQAAQRLGSGLAPIALEAADPVRVLHELDTLVRDTADMTRRIQRFAGVIGEALAADVSAMSLAQLRRLCGILLQLAAVPAPNPSWANPAEAHAAGVVLSALGDDLRELAQLRRDLYEEFSEDVWTLSCGSNPPSIDRWWQAGRRRRARRELTIATRNGRPPTDVRRAITTLRRASELETGVHDLWAAVSGSLGHFVDAGIPDVDGAAGALACIKDLQIELGELLDVARVRDLCAADAFVCDELAGPAGETIITIAAWASKAMRAGAVDPLDRRAVDLERWADGIRVSLAVLASLKDGTRRLRSTVRSVGQILGDAILRDRVFQLCEAAAVDRAPIEVHR